ncbi:WAT1-related protein At2g39510-like [Aristolochia californica]|uniref:WAT1-related protein At2g39510-like n=1 Tax=Aristolochia californica TaxID=171875 RepID=UPI0035DD85AC
MQRTKPYLAVIWLQFGYAGMNIIATIALNQGMSHYVLVVYRHVIAMAVMAPFAIVFERKVRPRMSLSTFFKILGLGLLEPVMDQNLYYAGLKYTSASFTSALCNVLPALTFLLACIFRLEKVNLKKAHGVAKVVGTLVTVAGAMIMTLIKGPALDLMGSKRKVHVGAQPGELVKKEWVKGSLMLTAGCFCWACFMILQAFTLRSYPAELSLTALVCLAGTIEGAVVGLVMERGDKKVWSIRWDAKLLTVVYAGIVCSGIAYYVQGVVMKTRGPVFISAFSPLSMILVAVLGSFILSEQIFLGSVIGAIIIVIGLYTVVWGKSKDSKVSTPEIEEEPISLELPKVETDSKPLNSIEFVSIVVRPPDQLSS